MVSATSVRIRRSLAKRLRRGDFEVRTIPTSPSDRRLRGASRTGGGTWIHPGCNPPTFACTNWAMPTASKPAWDGTLVGGLYGIALGRVFFGESMFSRVGDASKVALAPRRHLEKLGFAVMTADCPPDDDARTLGASGRSGPHDGPKCPSWS